MRGRRKLLEEVLGAGSGLCCCVFVYLDPLAGGVFEIDGRFESGLVCHKNLFGDCCQDLPSLVIWGGVLTEFASAVTGSRVWRRSSVCRGMANEVMCSQCGVGCRELSALSVER